MAAHEQVWAKVNAKVDRGMARIVNALSSLEGLETLQSCEGTPSGEAYIYFWYGNSWECTCRLVFAELLPALESREIQTTAAVEIFNGSVPTAKIGFSTRMLEQATLAIESFVHSARQSDTKEASSDPS